MRCITDCIAGEIPHPNPKSRLRQSKSYLNSNQVKGVTNTCFVLQCRIYLPRAATHQATGLRSNGQVDHRTTAPATTGFFNQCVSELERKQQQQQKAAEAAAAATATADAAGTAQQQKTAQATRQRQQPQGQTRPARRKAASEGDQQRKKFRNSRIHDTM